jgi:nucleotide-binding universal stress UspA family protein
MKILLAYDGSDAAEEALRDLRRAGIPAGSSLTILTVDEPPPVPLDFDVSSITRHHHRSTDLRRIALSAREQLRSLLPTLPVEIVSAEGRLSEQVVASAAAKCADVVVAGAPERTLFAHFGFGSEVPRIIHRAACTVRVGRDHHAGDAAASVRLVVGLDTSENAASLVLALLEREWGAGAEIWLVTALEPELRGTVHYQDALRVREMHRAQTDTLARAGAVVHSIVRDGDASGTLLSVADEIDADAIHVATRGLGGLYYTFLGSTSTVVAEHAVCTVEIHRRNRHNDRRGV